MIRTGLGYDSHRFAPDRALVLGGVTIPCDVGLAGHSDADALCHAVTDAILGAAAAGDIGEHFPPSDAKWKGADSTQFVAAALAMAAQRGLGPVHCDVTIITEKPRLTDHKPAIAANLARLLGLDADSVNIKAKTNEALGWIGRGEGLAVMAVVTCSDGECH